MKVAIVLCLLVLALCGCASDRTCAAVSDMQGAMHGAADSLPPSPQRDVLLRGTTASAAALGHPLTLPGVSP